MRTYDVAYMYEGVVLYRTTLKAANKYDCRTNAQAMIAVLPLRRTPTSIYIKQIKHKGDR